MAEQVKRRVAAARMAVAFVAAGTIAGATAWAQADPPPPLADESAAYLKSPKVTGDDIVDGSLLFEDFKKGEVASGKHFKKVELNYRAFKKATLKNYALVKGQLGDIKTQVDGVKSELISSYVKLGDADARYMKIDASVIDGDGQVLTTSKQVGTQVFSRLAEVAGMFTVDAEGPTVRITNTGGLTIQHSSCDGPAGPVPAGEIAPGGHIDCLGDGSVTPVQLIDAGGPGGGPRVATLNLFSFSWGANTYKSTVQILVGL